MKREELIQRVHDGEVDPAEAEEAARLVVEPDARARLEQLGRVGEIVRALHAERAAPDLTDAILSRVHAERAGEHPRSEVRELVPRPRREVVVGMVGALALAAALALMLRRPAAPEHALAPRSAAPVAAPSQPEAAPDAVATDSPVSIESVDFGAVQGAIFMVSTGPATDTLVVWTFDDADDKERKLDL